MTTQERFLNVKVRDYYETKDNLDNLISISTGFHAFVSESGAKSHATDIMRIVNHAPCAIIVECTYPKGYEYYEDVTGLCVANQITINKIIP